MQCSSGDTRAEYQNTLTKNRGSFSPRQVRRQLHCRDNAIYHSSSQVTFLLFIVRKNGKAAAAASGECPVIILQEYARICKNNDSVEFLITQNNLDYSGLFSWIILDYANQDVLFYRIIIDY